MAKYRVWVRIDDCGDGSNSSRTYPSEEAAIKGDFDQWSADNEENPYPNSVDEDHMDQFGMPVEISESVFDTEGYELIEA